MLTRTFEAETRPESALNVLVTIAWGCQRSYFPSSGSVATEAGARLGSGGESPQSDAGDVEAFACGPAGSTVLSATISLRTFKSSTASFWIFSSLMTARRITRRPTASAPIATAPRAVAPMARATRADAATALAPVDEAPVDVAPADTAPVDAARGPEAEASRADA